MKKKALFLLLCGCWYAMADATIVTGRIVEQTTKMPMEFADVALYCVSDSSFVAEASTDAEGIFQITTAQPAEYYVEYRFIGYEAGQSPVFTVSSQDKLDLGTLYLYSHSEYLQEVVVSGKRSTFEQKFDKRVFHVGTDLMSSAGSVSDLMRNIPSVQVDVAGNVSLRGNENVTILIDGKPSALMNPRMRADVLRQIPAAEIEQIEVVTNPSAQYKPDGVGGIINLVRKKQRKAGVTGNIVANLGTRERKNATASVGYNTGWVNLFASYGIRRDLFEIDNTDERVRNEHTRTYVSQQTVGGAKPLSHLVRLGAEWQMNARNRLQLNGGFNTRRFLRNDQISATERDANRNITYQNIRYRYDNEKVKQWESGGVYTYRLGDNHELTADYSYSSLEGLEDNRYATYSTDGDSKDNTQIWQAYYQHLFRMAYHRSWGERLKLNLGYELDALQTDLNYHVQNLTGDTFVPDMNRTNDFTNQETNHAFYATLAYKAGKWNVQLGLRPELMQIKSHLFSLDSLVNSHYFMVYPTLHTAYLLNGNSELRLSYSLRMNRPEADELNPFPEYQNPLTLKAGNPYLKPEKIHSVEAGYQWRNGVTTILGTLYYRYVTNQLTTVTRYMSDNVLLTTTENLNNASSAGAEFIADTGIGKWLTLNMTGNLFYNQINAARLGYGNHKDTFAWSASLNADFVPFANALLQLNARYFSSVLLPQGRREGSFTTDLGVKYEIPRWHLSLTATLSDVFGTLKRTDMFDTPQLQQRIEQRSNTRVFYIGLIWDFEKSLKNRRVR